MVGRKCRSFTVLSVGIATVAAGLPGYATASPPLRALSSPHITPIELALLPLCCCFQLLQHIGVDLLLQVVGPLVQLPHEPKLTLQLQRHIGHACGCVRRTGEAQRAPRARPAQQGLSAGRQQRCAAGLLSMYERR